MVPLILAGIAAATAIANYIQAEKARGAASAEIDRLQQIYNNIKSPKLDKNGTPAPAFDMSNLTPEDYKVVAQYVPEAAARIEEVNPTIVKETAAMGEGREAQLSALRRLSGISQQEQDPELMQTLNMASQRGQMEAQSRGQSILQDANRRGMLGSGLSAAMQGQAGIGSMQQAAMTSQDAATQAYKNRLQAMMQGAELGGSIRTQDISLQGKNADIINAFNQRTTRAAQDLESQRIADLNNARRYNAGVAQDIDNKNVAQRYDANVVNRTRQDSLAKYGAEWNRSAQQYGNTQAQQEFNNDLAKANGQAGVSGNAVNNMLGAGQDKANAITGLGAGASSVANYYGNQESLNEMQNRADARAYYNKTGQWPTGSAKVDTMPYLIQNPNAEEDAKKYDMFAKSQFATV